MHPFPVLGTESVKIQYASALKITLGIFVSTILQFVTNCCVIVMVLAFPITAANVRHSL